MYWTLITVSICLVFLIIIMFAWAACLKLGLIWARVSDVTKTQLAIATIANPLLGILFETVIVFFVPVTESYEIWIGIGELVVGVSIPLVTISLVFRIGFGRAFKAWIPTWLVAALSISLALFVFRPFVYEAFIITTGSMSPTLVGHHWTDVCPECGQPCYCSALETESVRARETTLMICDNFHVNEFPIDKNWESSEGDRILVAKFVRPKRWDLIVFKSPPDPPSVYTMRLIGLPGEKIHIEGGAVFVNDSKLDLPEFLTGIEYSDYLENWPDPLWGTSDNPAILADDEYFVLGDFSLRSMDSRLWDQGAPGYHPYAVPESSILGVVKHVFWPPEHWRTFE